MTGRSDGPVRLLVHAPFGRDFPTLAAALGRAGLQSCAIGRGVLAGQLDAGCGGLILTQEALVPAVVEALPAALGTLPAWSAPQVTLLLDDAEAAAEIVAALRAVRPQIATPVLLRPTAEVELISVVRAGIEARRTQLDLGRTLDDQARATEQAEFLLKELHHRTQNLFAMIDALARQTVDGTSDAAAFKSEFSGRIQALSATYHAIRDSAESGAALHTLINSTVGALLFDSAEATRIRAEGPSVHVPESVATALALALHELATNARKYGALSNAAGFVILRWHQDGQHIRLTWHEHGGPPVAPPTREGFGSTVIRQGLAAAGAQADVHFDAAGVRATIILPPTVAPA